MEIKLAQLVQTLNNIEVKGQTNLALLYNAIDSVKNIAAELASKPVEGETIPESIKKARGLKEVNQNE